MFCLTIESLHSYPGRASAQIHTDLLITLLQMGQSTWQELLKQREELFPVLKVG